MDSNGIAVHSVNLQLSLWLLAFMSTDSVALRSNTRVVQVTDDVTWIGSKRIDRHTSWVNVRYTPSPRSTSSPVFFGQNKDQNLAQEKLTMLLNTVFSNCVTIKIRNWISANGTRVWTIYSTHLVTTCCNRGVWRDTRSHWLQTASCVVLGLLVP